MGMLKCTLTIEQKIQYRKYKEEWLFKKNSNRNGFVDWSISNKIGDPFDEHEWLERPYLHNFEGTNL
jgi:hypothetical protein